MKQSKPLYQLDKLWFVKENYPKDWLSEKSKEIINKLNKKNMKNLILTLLLPLTLSAQTFYSRALSFHNEVRSFYDLPSVQYDNNLALQAQIWADYLAKTNTFQVSSDQYGENIFWAQKSYISARNKDVLLEATVNWLLAREDDYATYNQMVFPGATNVGYGVSESDNTIYVVAKYNKLYQ